MSSKKLKKNLNSTDSVGDVKETKNPTAEKCDKRSSYNPDDKDKYQEMFSAAVELQILTTYKSFNKKNTSLHIDIFIYQMELIGDFIHEKCEAMLRDYWETQDKTNKNWYYLTLSEKMEQFVDEVSNLLTTRLKQLSNEDN